MRTVRPVALALIALIVSLATVYVYLHGMHVQRFRIVQSSTSVSSGAAIHAWTRASEAVHRDTLIIALGDWGPPSPYLFYPRGPGYVLTSFIFDTLVWKDSHDVIPWLAVSWQHPNATTWVFRLRRGVYWQDGEPLTARDVVFTFRYVMEHGWVWRNISSIVASVYAPDDYTVVVKLRKPYPFFLEDIASTLFILPEHVWRDVTNPYAFRSRKAFIGSGPYRLVEYKPQRYYLFEANEGFWLGKPVYKYVKVVATGFSNPQSEAEALKEGRVDTAVFMGKAYRVVKMLEKSMGSRVRVLQGPMYWVLFLGFNLDKWPYNVTLFRRAIAYSLSLTELIERVLATRMQLYQAPPAIYHPTAASTTQMYRATSTTPVEPPRFSTSWGCATSTAMGAASSQAVNPGGLYLSHPPGLCRRLSW